MHKLFCLVGLVWVAIAQATLTVHIQSPWRNDASKDGYFLHILGGAGGSYNAMFGANSPTITTDEGDGWYSYTWNKNVLRRWQKPGDITDIPRVELNSTRTVTSNYLVDASYFAIKNITLGYTLPKAWMSKAGLSNVRVFASVDNLALFTHLDGMDPQYNFSGGTDYSYAPNKTWTVGLEVKF